MNKDKLISIAKGAGIAALGAILTYATQFATGADFGSATPVIVAVLSVLSNAVRKFVEKEKPDSTLEA